MSSREQFLRELARRAGLRGVDVDKYVNEVNEVGDAEQELLRYFKSELCNEDFLRSSSRADCFLEIVEKFQFEGRNPDGFWDELSPYLPAKVDNDALERVKQLQKTWEVKVLPLLGAVFPIVQHEFDEKNFTFTEQIIDFIAALADATSPLFSTAANATIGSSSALESVLSKVQETVDEFHTPLGVLLEEPRRRKLIESHAKAHATRINDEKIMSSRVRFIDLVGYVVDVPETSAALRRFWFRPLVPILYELLERIVAATAAYRGLIQLYSTGRPSLEALGLFANPTGYIGYITGYSAEVIIPRPGIADPIEAVRGVRPVTQWVDPYWYHAFYRVAADVLRFGVSEQTPQRQTESGSAYFDFAFVLLMLFVLDSYTVHFRIAFGNILSFFSRLGQERVDQWQQLGAEYAIAQQQQRPAAIAAAPAYLAIEPAPARGLSPVRGEESAPREHVPVRRGRRAGLSEADLASASRGASATSRASRAGIKSFVEIKNFLPISARMRHTQTK